MSTCVFLDTETGGLRSDSPIIEIAAVAVDLHKWNEIETYEQKLQFDVAACEPEALSVNGYEPEAWRNAVSEREFVAELQQFLNRYCCVSMISGRSGKPYSVARVGGHNVAHFDIDRISRAFRRQSVFFPIYFAGVLDTIHLASWYFVLNPSVAKPASYKLHDLAAYFDIRIFGREHTALTDVRTTIGVARSLVAAVHNHKREA